MAVPVPSSRDENRETFVIGRYVVKSEDNGAQTNQMSHSWDCDMEVEEIPEVFCDSAFSGDVDWSDQGGVYLTSPDSSEMTIKLRVPE